MPDFNLNYNAIKNKLCNNIDETKRLLENTVSSIRVDAVLETKEYVKAQVNYYEFLRVALSSLVGERFCLHNYEIDGIKYPTVYCVVLNAPDYKLRRVDGWQSTTQIIGNEVSGVQLDVSHFYEVPIACLCVSCSDTHKYYCNDNNNEETKKYAGCTQCLKDSADNDHCARMSLRFASYPISDFVLHDLNKPCASFRFENEMINPYEFDYSVKLFEDYERYLFEERLCKIKRYMDGESHFHATMSEITNSITYSNDETDKAFEYLYGNSKQRWQTWHGTEEFDFIYDMINTEDGDFDVFV